MKEAIQEAVQRFAEKIKIYQSNTSVKLENLLYIFETELTRIAALTREEICEMLAGMKKAIKHHESCLALGENGDLEPNEKYCDCGHPEQWKAYNQALYDAIEIVRNKE